MDTYDHIRSELNGKPRQYNMFTDYEAEKLKRTRKRVLVGVLFLVALLIGGTVAIAEEPMIAGVKVEQRPLFLCSSLASAMAVVKAEKERGSRYAMEMFSYFAQYGVCDSIVGDVIPLKQEVVISMGHPVMGFNTVYIHHVMSPYTDRDDYMISNTPVVGEFELSNKWMLGGDAT